MSIVRRTEPNADALAAELIAARQAYEAKRDSVVTRATERRAAVRNTLSDLQQEELALKAVENAAKA